MFSGKSTLVVLSALALMAAGGSTVYGGSTLYVWTATGQDGVLLTTGIDSQGNWIYESPPVTSGHVWIAYDPSWASYPGQTSGYTTSFEGSNVFTFATDVGPPGFSGWYEPSLTITAPPRGGGLDSITFDAGSLGHTLGLGEVMILAPNGTLATSTELPATLDAFVNYSLKHPGGYVVYSPPNGTDFPFYFGAVSGTLGAAPEPSTIVSLMTGMAIVLCSMAIRRRSGRPAADVASVR